MEKIEERFSYNERRKIDHLIKEAKPSEDVLSGGLLKFTRALEDEEIILLYEYLDWRLEGLFSN